MRPAVGSVRRSPGPGTRRSAPRTVRPASPAGRATSSQAVATRCMAADGDSRSSAEMTDAAPRTPWAGSSWPCSAQPANIGRPANTAIAVIWAASERDLTRSKAAICSTKSCSARTASSTSMVASSALSAAVPAPTADTASKREQRGQLCGVERRLVPARASQRREGHPHHRTARCGRRVDHRLEHEFDSTGGVRQGLGHPQPPGGRPAAVPNPRPRRGDLRRAP